MNEDEIFIEIIKANADAAYKDAAQPSVRVVGKSLAQCVSLFATPVGRLAEILEDNLHLYLDKLKDAPVSKIISPSNRILVPILEKMRYIEDETVADYYAQILANASKKDTASKVLVSFIKILDRLSADEIRILEFLHQAQRVLVGKLTDQQCTKYGLSVGTIAIMISDAIPIIDINLHVKGQTGYRCISKNFSYLTDRVKLDDSSNLESYLDNLFSLGLIERGTGTTFAITEVYKILEEHSLVKKIKLGEGSSVRFVHGRIDMTSLGKRFLELCSNRHKR